MNRNTCGFVRGRGFAVGLVCLLIPAAAWAGDIGLVANGDMEGGSVGTGHAAACNVGTSLLPQGFGWNADAVPEGGSCAGNCFNAALETGIRRSGGHSTRLSFCTNGSSAVDGAVPGIKGVITQTVIVGADARFRVKAWALHSQGSCPPILAWNPGTDANIETANDASPSRITRIDPDNAAGTTNRWQSATLYGALSGGQDRITVMVGGAAMDGSAGASVYIDDVEVTVLSASLANGGFETGAGGGGSDAAGNGGYAFEGWDVGAAGSGAGPADRGIAGQGIGSPAAPQAGQHFAYTGTCGASRTHIFSQVVNVTPGGSYTLRAHAFQHAGSDADPPRIGHMHGTATFRTAEPIFAGAVTLGVQGAWTALSLTFTATQPTVTLILQARHTQGNCWSASFDEVTFGPACTGVSITGQPATQTVCPGEPASFTVTPSGTGPFAYQWFKGTTLLNDGSNLSGTSGPTLAFSPVTTADVGANYRCVVTNACGTATSNNAVLNVNTPVRITSPPTNAAACVGASATLRVSAFAAPTSSYRWRRGTTNLVNGGNISGATTPTLTINPVGLGDGGDDFNCVITNVCGSLTTANVALTVQTPPIITGQPSSQTVCTGDAISFAVTAGGVPAPTYQWRRGTTVLADGGSVSAAQTATLTIGPVTAGDAASNYHCVVTNVCGSAASSQVTLAIDQVPPTIICPPNVEIGSGTADCGTLLNPGTPVASDNCGPLSSTPGVGTGGTVTSVRSDGRPVSDPYPVGVTTVTWTATDVNGLTSSCDQSVTVLDDQPPTILSCATGQTVAADGGCNAVMPEFVAGLDARDGCSGLDVLTRTQDPPAGSVVGSGVSKVTIFLRDAAGNESSCAAAFLVIDSTPPTPTCQDVAITLDANGQATLGSAQVSQTASDNCGVMQRGLSKTSFNCLDVGATTVTLTVRDAAGNEGACIAQVIVNDLDTDGDGVGDCIDACDDDPLKSSAGQCGCGVADTDADGDGAAECVDACPADPHKTAPGVCGCGVADVDTDGDGAANCVDACPEDPAKVQAGVCGCGTTEADGDQDGTNDCEDACPEDANKTSAGTCGCGVSDVDSDADGVADCLDACPDDAAKSAPGVCGCGVSETDSDGDGTPDCRDACPDDAAKVAEGICGCGAADSDSDGDRVLDCLDGCPADAAKSAPGRCGCGAADVDGDADGALDCEDACPADPAKVVEGLCGCGIADADDDGDGVVNCQDACPNDPRKVSPGSCGCGVAETNADGDAVPDCMDACPNDVQKTLPGVCGCGVPETDTDGDGTPDCQDGCPNDPNRAVAGENGCGGGSEDDADGDGVPDRRDKCPHDPNKKRPGACGCGIPDTDNDEDRVPNCRDNCPDQPNRDQKDRDRDGIGDACDPDCAAVLVQADRYVVGTGWRPSVRKEPIAGMQVCVFDRFEGSCARSYGNSWRHYEEVHRNCTPVACGTTAADGSVRIELPAGDYIVIGRHGAAGGNDDDALFVADRVGDVRCAGDRDPGGITARAYLPVIEDATGKQIPGKSTRWSGWNLRLIEPEYVIWDGATQYYPFLFEGSQGARVTACVLPPRGCSPDRSSSRDDCRDSISAFQFTLTGMGRDLKPAETTFEITWRGRTLKIRGHVDLCLTEGFARPRGWNLSDLRKRGLLWEKSVRCGSSPRRR